MPFDSIEFHGNKRVWTKRRVLDGLRLAMTEIDGPLPCNDGPYNVIKKGRLAWPPVSRVYEFFKALAHGWLAAGAAMSRVSLHNAPWTPGEISKRTLARIARDLGRSYQATRARIGSKGLGITARANQGLLSAAELAKLYHTPYHRVRELLINNSLPGTYDRVRNRWQIDPSQFTPEMESLLRAPKKTYTTSPTDIGDYYRRYGLYRTRINGRTSAVEK